MIIEQQLVDFEKDRPYRLTFPAKLVEGLGWLDKAQELSVLLKFAEPGSLSVLSWAEHGAGILARKEELEKRLPDENAENALLLLNDRYLKNPIERSWRIALPVIAMIHLFGFQPYEKTVFVVRRTSGLEVRSLAYRNTKLLEHSRLLEDLP